MAIIRPCADLRNNYTEISKICHETNEPIFITKNGTNDLVLLSDEAYNNLSKHTNETTEEKVDKLIAEKFDKHYENFEEFQKDFFEKINQALKDVEEGRCQSFEEFCAEMEAKYNIND